MLDIIFQKKEGTFPNLEDQRLAVLSIIFELTGCCEIMHTETGRPKICDEFDVSISHKNDVVCVGMIASPFQIGVDVENIACDISSKLFLQSVITEKEKDFFQFFCQKNNISETAAIAIFWSIKESFFKCLDHDLMPAKISIANIGSNGFVEIELEPSILNVMNKHHLTVCHAWVAFNEKHVNSCFVMEKINEKEKFC